MNYMERAFEPIENDNYNTVLQNTWGHLAPELNRRYPFKVLFAVTEWGETTQIKTELGDDLNDSPWLAQQTTEFVSDLKKPVGVWYFVGEYVTPKTERGTPKFIGKTKPVQLPF